MSTAIVGCPKAIFRTTFAVFRPTPGRASKLSRLFGTILLWRSISRRLVAMILRALLLNNPIERT